MLISILNVCSKEELDEEEEEEEEAEALAAAEAAAAASSSAQQQATITAAGDGDEMLEDADGLIHEAEDGSEERRAVVKQKILAVGRMSRVFALLREEAERVSELKSVSPSGKLPYGSLASGAEGIKEAITNFDDARKVDIENERLPPDLIDADEASLASLEGRGSSSFDESRGATTDPSAPTTPGSPGGPSSPGGAAPAVSAGGGYVPTNRPGHRRGHSRTSSLGTTNTSSPSNRRRSLESTVNMIREALAGEEGIDESSFEKLADSVASPASPKVGGEGGFRRSGSVKRAQQAAQQGAQQQQQAGGGGGGPA